MAMNLTTSERFGRKKAPNGSNDSSENVNGVQHNEI
jgi:hypothetical protein